MKVEKGWQKGKVKSEKKVRVYKDGKSGKEGGKEEGQERENGGKEECWKGREGKRQVSAKV